MKREVFQSASSRETEEIGERLAERLTPGAVLLLVGELGSGKTTMIKGIARGLDVEELVTSPTFKLISEYRGRVPFYHFDLYRLKSMEEVQELGFEEYFFAQGVTVVEWAEKIKPLWPPGRIEVYLDTVSEKEREVRIEDYTANKTNDSE